MKLILRGKRFGHTLEEIADMIGLASAEMDEREQIRKTLEYGNRSLKEIHQRIEELRMFEADILEMETKLRKRLEELDEGDKNESG